MIDRRISQKLALRVDPEGVVQDAFVRAWPRWQAADPKPADVDAWVYRQVLDRLNEVSRSSLGPKRDVARDISWPDGSADPLAEHLVDSQTGPTSAISRAERREAVRVALEQLDPVDRELLTLRYFDGMGFDQIGLILGLSQNAATKRALRAMVRLRNLIPPTLRS
jgi:RNA polymerase sigma-70 factor (ECF subfamily)